MASPEPNAGMAFNMHNVQMNGPVQGPVIGPHAQVTQNFYSTSSQQQVDLAAIEAAYRGQVISQYQLLPAGNHWRLTTSRDIPLEKIFLPLTLRHLAV
jgi:hypothetical protein